MIKEVFFIRHSKPGKCCPLYKWFSLQKQNEKKRLINEGKLLAEKAFQDEMFKNIEEIYSSNYLRTYQTAKILSRKYGIKVKVNKNFGERKIGIKEWNEYPSDFEIHQFKDNNYKLPNGESLHEVRKRELNALNNILKNSNAKCIAIISHSTAMMTLFSKWCETSYDSDYYFNGKKFFDGKWNYCETFKLTFDDDKLVDIVNVKL